MIIIGAKGFAKELIQVLDNNGELSNNIIFYDDISEDLPCLILGKYRIYRTMDNVKDYFLHNSSDFVLGIGDPHLREYFYYKMVQQGGEPYSVISKTAAISQFGVTIQKGICIMQNSIIENDTVIGIGSLIHNTTMIGHDSIIGSFCEISPGAKILGRVKIGDLSSVGSNAVILPDIKIGKNVRVGAGAVVTKDVSDNLTVVGVPAKQISC